MQQSRSFLNNLLGSLTILAAVIGIVSIWPINRWSVVYLEHRLSSGSEHSVLPDPPEKHLRSKIWLAEEALETKDEKYLMTFLQPLLSQNDPLAWRVRGKINYAMAKPFQAIEAFQKAKDLYSLLDYAELMTADGYYVAAEQAYQFIIDDMDSDLAVLPYTNLLSNQLGNSQKAISVLQEAMKKYPSSALYTIWLRYLGDLLSADGKWNEAIAIYQETLSLDPQAYWAYMGLGKTTYDQGVQYKSAIDWYRKAIEVNPDISSAYYQIAAIMTKERLYEDADLWYVEAIARNHQAYYWWIARANNMRMSEDFETAVSLYQEAADTFPEQATIYFEMALNYQMLGNKIKAQASIEKALALMDISSAQYYLRAGEIYEWAGNTEKAISIYHDLLLIEPTNSTALDALQRLEAQNPL